MYSVIREIFASFGISQCGFCSYDAVLPLLPVRSASRIPENAKTVIFALFPYNIGEYPDRNISRYAIPDDYHHIAYVKNAQVTWKPGHLTLEGGMISTTQFKVQEKHWGYRYIMKSFQDEYKFGSSADLGISAAYKFADWVSADAIIVNGEGYKRVQVSDGLQYGLGATFMPVEGLTLRLYGSINESSIDQIKDAYNWAAFAGYKHKYFSLGAEYNIYQNAKFERDHDLYGLSVYGTAHVSKVVDIFARYDNLSSNNDWNILKDESAAMLGAQIKLGKYVKIAPNVRMSIPSAPGADNHYSAYVSCYFGI